jgi:hypothetical protein
MRSLTIRFLISTIVFCSSLSLVDSYKIYAKTKIGSSKQFKCLDKLWIKEVIGILKLDWVLIMGYLKDDPSI